MSSKSCNSHVETFALEPGRRLARKYIVGELLGHGWEGEVYHVTEIATGVERAAKFFFPQRNPNNRASKFYATKLNKLRACSMIIQYHTQDTLQYRKQELPFLVSEYVDGELLSDHLARQPGKRLQPFEAVHLLHRLAVGIEQIHKLGEYHGDLHSDNIIVERVGLGYRMKLVDLYEWGRPTKAHLQEDICSLIQIMYEAIGGQRRYALAPELIKGICCGRKRSLITKKFPTISTLREYLENMPWE